MNMMMMTSDKNQLREISFLHPTTSEDSADIFSTPKSKERVRR
jgi:hypothetical protein